jgi:hypothetical protein
MPKFTTSRTGVRDTGLGYKGSRMEVNVVSLVTPTLKSPSVARILGNIQNVFQVVVIYNLKGYCF